MRNTCPLRPARSGFTLIELMVVIVILGILAVIVVVNVVQYLDKGRQSAAMAQIRHIETAIIAFKADQGRWPSTLEELAVRPGNAKFWPPDGYLDHVPKDPWGNEYRYVKPGENGKSYDIICFGEDGETGGNEAARDLTNHNMDQQ